MKDMYAFLYGKVVAKKMRALEEGLQEIAQKHQSYFGTIRSIYALDGEEKPATLAEFVRPRWINLQPTLWIAPTLPPDIAAECLACLERIRT
jgi:hypothetical protein